MVPRPHNYVATPFSVVSTVAAPLEIKFNSYVSYILTLIKIVSILVLHTHHLFFCPLTLVSDELEDGRLLSGPNFLKFIPPTHNRCHRL